MSMRMRATMRRKITRPSSRSGAAMRHIPSARTISCRSPESAAPEGQQKHPEKALAAVLLIGVEADRHTLMARLRRGAIGAEQIIPAGEIEAEIAVMLRPDDRMMDAVHVGRHDDFADDPVKPGRQAGIGMIEERER